MANGGAARQAGGADRIWLRQYADGVPADIDTSAYPSLAAVIDRACEQYRELTAFENLGGALSYDDLDRLSQDFASWLQNIAGLHPGDRVAVMMPNLLQYPIAVFGILRAGLVVVNVNPLYTPRELQHQLKDSGARVIVVVENCAATLQQVIADTPLEAVITTRIGDLLPFPKNLLTNFVVKRVKKRVPAFRLPNSLPFRTVLASGRAQPYHRVQLGHDDVAFLQYTGGTTGLSKGATLSHGNMVANLMQMQAWIGPKLDEGRDVVITALPLYHIFALTVNALLFAHVGAKNVLITDPRDLDAFVAELDRQPFTAFTGVNTLFNALLHHPDFADVDFSALKFAVGGGAAVQQAVAERWKAVTGVALTEGYGLSETSPGVCFSPLDRPDWNGTIGVPLPSTWVSLRDDDEQEVAIGAPGELCVKGPQVMRGYWNKPEENRKAFTADGWFKTGDIATVDEAGWFRIVDRKKDMILVSGFNVYPNEIENVVALHAGVLECACIGVPDHKSGEAVKVFVVRRDLRLTPEALREHCQAHLTGYKVPKAFEFRDTLPKSNVGKILRKELRT
ncbi:AMP-binding protein [Nevskia sp.]|uniref:AMP-binding protein n=1 Tax=Nevskia sp. TaxID=1929292 RepID=UPI0025D75B03|nr:AMP-binding protein [Nevskia sp.]